MDAFVGIDPGSHRPGFALIDGRGLLQDWNTPELEGDSWPDRIVHLRQLLVLWLDLVAGGVTLDVVAAAIERPNTGRTTNLVTIAAWGVCVEATRARLGCPVFEEVGSTEWKAEVLGHGAATDAAVQHFALAAGWAGGAHDGAVAACLAACAKGRYDRSIEFASRRPDA